MVYTDNQKEVLSYLKMAKVQYKKMWKSQSELAYVKNGTPLDTVCIAKDYPHKDIQKIALIHEAGHIYLGHTSVNLNKEILSVKDIFTVKGVPYSSIMNYGGPISFINIAMDLEVNSKLLTLSNIRRMDSELSICTLDKYGASFKDNFRDYYDCLIERLKNNEQVQPLLDSLEDLASNMESMSFEGLSSEITDMLMEESYGTKFDTSDAQDSSDCSTLGQELENESSEGMGLSSRIIGENAVEGDPSKKILLFLKSIINFNNILTPDSIKNYNRGTRYNPQGILYTSIRRKVRTQSDKFLFICDVSGSMPTEAVIKAVASLNNYNGLDSDSKLLLWDTSNCGEYLLRNIPKNIPSGGGTDIAKALAYAKLQGYNNVVVYSDFCTNMNSLIKESSGIQNLYSIVLKDSVDSNFFNSDNSELKKYLKMNKKHLFL